MILKHTLKVDCEINLSGSRPRSCLPYWTWRFYLQSVITTDSNNTHYATQNMNKKLTCICYHKVYAIFLKVLNKLPGWVQHRWPHYSSTVQQQRDHTAVTQELLPSQKCTSLYATYVKYQTQCANAMPWRVCSLFLQIFLFTSIMGHCK